MLSRKGISKVYALILVLIVIMAGLVVGAYYYTAAPKQPVDTVTMQLDWVPQGRFLGFNTAIAKGFYKNRNIDLTISPGKGGVGTVTNVGAGQFDFGYADAIPVILARAKGADVKVVAALQTDTPQGFDFLLKSGIKSPKDLEGKKMGTSQASVVYQSLPLFCKSVKIDCSKIIVQFLSPDLLTSSILSGAVDVTTGFKGSDYEVAIVEAGKRGEQVGWIGFAESGLDIYGTVLFAKESLIRQKPDLVKRFVAATVEGFKYAMDHIDEAVSTYLKDYPELNKQILEMQWKDIQSATMKSSGWSGNVDRDKMTRTVRAVEQVYNITSMDPQSTYVSPLSVSNGLSAYSYSSIFQLALDLVKFKPQIS